MDVKRCGFLSHTPTRFKFGWDEEAVLCIKLKQVLLQQIQLLRQRGFPVHPIPTASITIPAAANAAAGIEYSATISQDFLRSFLRADSIMKSRIYKTAVWVYDFGKERDLMNFYIADCSREEIHLSTGTHL